jgi:hypothetical protein
MRSVLTIAVAGLVGLVGCGGSMSSPPAPTTNALTGTLTITGALPAGAACLPTNTHTVTFSAGKVSPNAVSAAGGDCLTFINSDTVAHQPASIGSPACPELDAPGPLVNGQPPFTTLPLAGTKTCRWQDLLNPPGTPGY